MFMYFIQVKIHELRGFGFHESCKMYMLDDLYSIYLVFGWFVCNVKPSKMTSDLFSMGHATNWSFEKVGNLLSYAGSLFALDPDYDMS